MQRTLIVSRGSDSFEFFFEEEKGTYWLVRDHPDVPWFVIEEHLRHCGVDHVVHVLSDPYRNVGVNGLWGLYEALIREPEKTLERLFGRKFQIKEVKVR